MAKHIIIDNLQLLLSNKYIKVGSLGRNWEHLSTFSVWYPRWQDFRHSYVNVPQHSSHVSHQNPVRVQKSLTSWPEETKKLWLKLLFKTSENRSYQDKESGDGIATITIWDPRSQTYKDADTDELKSTGSLWEMGGGSFKISGTQPLQTIDLCCLHEIEIAAQCINNSNTAKGWAETSQHIFILATSQMKNK